MALHVAVTRRRCRPAAADQDILLQPICSPEPRLRIVGLLGPVIQPGVRQRMYRYISRISLAFAIALQQLQLVQRDSQYLLVYQPLPVSNH